MITFTHHISAGQPVTSFVKPKHVAVKGLYPREQMSPLTLLSPGSKKNENYQREKTGSVIVLSSSYITEEDPGINFKKKIKNTV